MRRQTITLEYSTSDFHISKSLVTCSEFCVPLLHWCVNKRSNINCYPKHLHCIQLCGTMRYRRLCDSQSMQLPMMLNASYNLPLTFCQLLVDLLCLGFLSCIPFVPMVMTLFFRGVCTILQLRCLLVTSRSEVVKWLV